FATGGIGGAHPGSPETGDVSPHLGELARVPLAVGCAGAKSILDPPRALGILGTLSVPVGGYGTDEFPAFYLRPSGERASARVDTPRQAADLLTAHWQLGGGGVVLAQPLPAEAALDADEFAAAMRAAERLAAEAGVRGKEVTPF